MATTAVAGGPIALSRPPFKLDTAFGPSDHLRAAGVTALLEGEVDLSGIAGAPGDLIATDLVHRAVIIVDDRGTPRPPPRPR